jgi:hypothetical protein
MRSGGLTLVGVASGEAWSLARSAPASDHGHLLIATSTLNSSPRISSGTSTAGLSPLSARRIAALIAERSSSAASVRSTRRPRMSSASSTGTGCDRPSTRKMTSLTRQKLAHLARAGSSGRASGSTNRETLARARNQGPVAEVALAAVDDAADVLEEADVFREAQLSRRAVRPSRSSEVPFGVPCLCSRCG